jgi:hypothetical protein
MAEAMAVVAVDGGNPFDSSSMLPLIKGSTDNFASFSSLCHAIYIRPNTHRNRTTPNNSLKMDRLISLSHQPFSERFPPFLLSDIDSRHDQLT